VIKVDAWQAHRLTEVDGWLFGPSVSIAWTLRQEGNVYRSGCEVVPPSVRRAMFIEPVVKWFRPPSGGQCL